MDDPNLKENEERKREASYDPLQRWLHIQDVITWAEENTLRTCAATGLASPNGWARPRNNLRRNPAYR